MFINFNLSNQIMALWAIPIKIENFKIYLDLQFFYYFFQKEIDNKFLLNYEIKNL